MDKRGEDDQSSHLGFWVSIVIGIAFFIIFLAAMYLKVKGVLK